MSARFRLLLIISAIGFAILSATAVSMVAPTDNETADAATAPTPHYQDNAQTVPGFGLCSGFLAMLLTCIFICFRKLN